MATLGSLRHASVVEQTFVLSLGAIPVESLLQLRSWKSDETLRYRLRELSHRRVSAKLAASEDEVHTILRNAFALCKHRSGGAGAGLLGRLEDLAAQGSQPEAHCTGMCRPFACGGTSC